MVNGPMGGNMGTPPVAPQPPQVSFTTTAESRGGFNNFLKSIPPTTAMTPLPPMGSPQMMPPMGGNPMGNIDIFNQPMGMMGINQPQMNPMMQPPMQQQPMNMGMMQQPMMMANGGGVPPRRTEIMGQDHMLSYITPEEGGILKALGGSGAPGPMGIPSFYGPGGPGDDGTDPSDDDGDGEAGAGEGTSESDISDAQAASGGYGGDNDPDDAMSAANQAADMSTTNSNTNTDDDNYSDTDFGGFSNYSPVDSPTSTSGTSGTKGFTNVTNVGPSSNVAYSPQFSADVAQSRGLDPSVTMSPEDYSMTTQGQAAAQAEMDDAMAIDQAINQAPAATNIAAAYSPQAFGLGLTLDDPLGLGVVTGYGPAVDAQVSGMYNATANPQSGTQMAGPGFDSAGNLSTVSADKTGLSNVADAMKGGSMLSYDPVANSYSYTNPQGNVTKGGSFSVDPSSNTAPASGIAAMSMPVGRPDNLVSRSLGIDVTNPAEMMALEDTLRDNVQLGLTMDDVNINTPAGQIEEDKETAGFMNAVLSGQVDTPSGFYDAPDITAGLDLSQVAPSSNVNAFSTDRSPGLMSAVFGPNVGSALGGLTVDEAMGLAGITDPSQTGTGFMPSPNATQAEINANIADQVSQTLGLNQNVAPSTTTFSVNPADFTGLMSSRDALSAPTTNSVVEAAIKDAVPSRSISDILGAMNQKTDLQSQVANSFARAGVQPFSPDVFDPTNQQISDMEQTIGPEVASGFSSIGSGVSPSFAAEQVAQAEVDQAPSSNSLGFASNQGIPGYDFSMTDVNPSIAVEAGGKGIGANVNTSPAPAGYEEMVGKAYSGTPIGQIESFYNAPTTMTQLGMPPGMINSALSVVENMAKDQIAADLISGNYTAITDSNGNITGSRNPATGEVQSGMDFNAPDTDDDNESNPLILRPISKSKKEEEEKKDGSPGVFGGGSADPKSSGPLVVDSPFTSNVGKYTPVGFDAGDLNALIARLTGISSPKSMAKGGVIGYQGGGQVMQALDNLLATG